MVINCRGNPRGCLFCGGHRGRPYNILWVRLVRVRPFGLERCFHSLLCGRTLPQMIGAKELSSEPELSGKGYRIQAAVLRKKGGPLKIESLRWKAAGRGSPGASRRLGICHTDIDFCDAWEEADNAVCWAMRGGRGGAVGKSVKKPQTRRPCRAFLSVLRPLPSMRSGHPAIAATFTRQTSVPAPGWQQCLHRSGVRGIFSVSLRSPPIPWRRNATSSRSPRPASGASISAGLRLADWSRHGHKLARSFQGGK